MSSEYFTIGAVERDSGIARDTLRIWERRYGFPQPLRNDKGERVYPESQLRRLQRIRRLLDQGLRPGKVVVLSDTALAALEADIYPDVKLDETVKNIIMLLQSSHSSELETVLMQVYKQQGMQDFILKTVIPLLHSVGERWARGQLQIFEEHLLSQVLARFINGRIATFERNENTPRVLLATLPGEEHTLGLLMVSSLLATRNVPAINLGAEVPLDQIVAAVSRFDADVLGLSFSGAYQYENIRSNILELREMLPTSVNIWLGGEAVKRMRRLPPGVSRYDSLSKLPLRWPAGARSGGAS